MFYKAVRIRFTNRNSGFSQLCRNIPRSKTRRLANNLPHPGLSTDHGGSIPTFTENKTRVPRATLYRVKLAVAKIPTQARWSRGRIAIEGESYSSLWRGVSYAAAALIRESGF